MIIVLKQAYASHSCCNDVVLQVGGGRDEGAVGHGSTYHRYEYVGVCEGSGFCSLLG